MWCASHVPDREKRLRQLCPSAGGGDTVAMLIARRRFLEAGHYRRLQEIVATIATRHLQPQAPDANQPVVVDVGCGEGSHLAEIGAAIKHAMPAVRLVGLDLSKAAATMTARRD
jgi:23S rRNA (guanine745-N1)-methyltransferase